MTDYIPNPYDTYEPEESTSTEAEERVEIEIKIDTEISCDHTGYYDYADRTYQWAKNPDDPRGDWYSEKYNVLIGEPVDMVEYIDELINDAPNFPDSAGKYRVTGIAHLVFNITDIEETRQYFKTEHDSDYDTETFIDNAEVDFNLEESSINNLKFIRIK